MRNSDKIEEITYRNQTQIAVIESTLSGFDKKLDIIQSSQIEINIKLDGLIDRFATKEEIKYIKYGLVVFILVIVSITGSEVAQTILSLFN